MIITTTPTVEGKTIDRYLGIVCGTDIYLVGGLLGGGLVSQEKLYTVALNNAIINMRQKAAAIGAQGVVGITTNFTSPGGANYMIITVNGTAVTFHSDGTETATPVPAPASAPVPAPASGTVPVFAPQTPPPPIPQHSAPHYSAPGAAPAHPVSPAAPRGPAEGIWYCRHCGTPNKTAYAQCKKCTRYRGR